jgi:hypothetical protein
VPSGLTAQVVGSTITLSWTASFDATGYRVEAGSEPGLANLGQLPAGVSTLVVRGAPIGNYFVRVRATNAFCVTAASPDIDVSVGAACSLPAAPTALTAGVAGTAVTLRWTAPLGPAPAGYVVEAGSAPGLANLATVPVAGASSILSVTDVPGGVYYLRVRANNTDGAGAPSNELTLVVGPPQAPTSTVTFEALAGTNTTPFASHAEATIQHTYLVEAMSGEWTVLATYGRPLPSIKLVRPLFDTDVTGAVRVTAGGARFRLASPGVDRGAARCKSAHRTLWS